MAKRKRRPKRSACTPPGNFIRTRTGSYAKVVRTTQANARNEALFRLKWIEGTHLVTSGTLWTIQYLTDSGVRWLKRAPKGYKEAS